MKPTQPNLALLPNLTHEEFISYHYYTASSRDPVLAEALRRIQLLTEELSTALDQLEDSDSHLAKAVATLEHMSDENALLQQDCQAFQRRLEQAYFMNYKAHSRKY